MSWYVFLVMVLCANLTKRKRQRGSVTKNTSRIRMQATLVRSPRERRPRTKAEFSSDSFKHMGSQEVVNQVHVSSSKIKTHTSSRRVLKPRRCLASHRCCDDCDHSRLLQVVVPTSCFPVVQTSWRKGRNAANESIGTDRVFHFSAVDRRNKLRCSSEPSDRLLEPLCFR